MEFAARGRSTAAVGGVSVSDGDGLRFSDPPPPHGGDAHSAPANMSTLVFRREELLREFHRERIRLDMILCDLAETERAMTACLAIPAAGWGAWCGRPSMHQCEETLYQTPRSSEETSWWRRKPPEPVIIPPVYPHVERSPSPVRQQQSVDVEQQERGSSSRALAVGPSACPDVEQCWSLNKEPAVEALVQAAINAVANPMEPSLCSEKVTLESRATVNQEQEHEQEFKESHGLQLTESGIQRSKQPKCPANGEKHETETKNSHVMQLIESELQGSEHPVHAAVGQEREAEAKNSHAMQPMECDVQSEQLKHAAVVQGRETKANVSHTVQVVESKFPKSEQVKCGVVVQQNKAEVKDSHEVPMESEMQRSEQPKCEASGQEHEAEEKDRHAAQPMEESGVQNSKQPKSAEPSISDRIDELKQLPHQYVLPGKEKSPPNEQMRLVVNEPKTLITTCGVKRRPIMRINRQRPLEESTCSLGQVNLTCEEDLTQHQARAVHWSNLTVSQSTQGAAGLTTKSAPESSHRPPLRPISNNDMESEIQRSEQPKCLALGQEREAEAKNSHAVQPMENEIQRSEHTKREAGGEERKAEEKDSHAGQLMKESGIQSSEQPKPAEPIFRDGIDERRQSPHVLPVKEKSPSNELKRLVFNETKAQITPSGVKRPILRPTVTTPPPKRHKPLDEWSCTLCHVNLTCEEDIPQHKEGELHRSKLAALRARQEASGFDLRNHLRGRSHPESTQALCTEEGGNEGGKCAVDRRGEDPRKKFISNRTLRTEEGGKEGGKYAVDRRGEDPMKKFINNRRFPFCELCKVECTSQKVMESHLGGKKHRENLQARY